MNRPLNKILIFLVGLSLLGASITACSSKEPVRENVISTATVSPASSVDPCAPANLPNEVAKLTRMMKRFDDITVLAQATPGQQLAIVILEMHRILGEAEELEVPVCLAPLKKEQLTFMQNVTTVMTNFLGGLKGEQLQKQILFSRNSRTGYEVELGKMLGYEYHTPTPRPTITATQVTPTSTLSPVTVTTSKDVDVFQSPATDSPKVGIFQSGLQANVIGRSKDYLWVLIEMLDSPDHKGWVAVIDVTISTAVVNIPEATVLPETTPSP